MSIIINGDTGVSGVDGSAATPSLQGTDTNTGIFYPAADTIAFAEGGVEAMRIDSSGRVLVGTSSASGAQLDVVDSTGNNNYALTIARSATNASSKSSAISIRHWLNAEEPVCLIGAGIDGNTDNDVRMGGGFSNLNSATNLIFYTAANNATTTGTERMRIDSSGIVTGTAGNLMLISGTSQATTSGTFVDFTGIPSWVKRVTVMFDGVSTSGTSNLLLQLGDSGGVETTGYLSYTVRTASTSVVGGANVTTGFGLTVSTTASYIISGGVQISNLTSNTWVAQGQLTESTGANGFPVSGSKSLSGTLDRIRITTTNGSDTFDAGTINILYE